jgi:hypothetical protein
MTTTTPRCDSSIVELPEVLSDLLTECQWTILDSRTGGRCYYIIRTSEGAGPCPHTLQPDAKASLELSAEEHRDYVVLRCASGHPYEEDVRTR